MSLTFRACHADAATGETLDVSRKLSAANGGSDPSR